MVTHETGKAPALTAAVIVELAQEGRLDLDDSVSKYVSGVPDGDHINHRRPGEVICGDGKCCALNHPGAGIRWTNYPNFFRPPMFTSGLSSSASSKMFPKYPQG